MFDGRRVLVVVPARGGSRGIKLKNLREVGGVPLIVRVGAVVRELDFVDRAVASTDHDEIARVAEAAGLAVPFRRPPDLSGDVIGDLDVLCHAIETMEQIDQVTFDIIVMLQPTSPSRTADHVKRCVERLVEGDFQAVWTLSETDSKAHPLKQLVTGEDGTLGYYDARGAKIVARQQLEPVYHRNGIAYAFTRACLMDEKSIMGAPTGFVVIEEPTANIDTEQDIAWAEMLLEKD